MEEAYTLRKILLGGTFGDLSELINEKTRVETRSRRINDYIESVLSSHDKIMERLPTPEDLDRYYREFYVVGFINVIRSTIVDPQKIDRYKSIPYFYIDSKEEALTRCCVHRHLIRQVCQL